MSIVARHILKIATERIEQRGKYPSDRAISKKINTLRITYTDRGVTIKFPKTENK